MKKIAFVFPGQGSQFIGMGKALYDQHEQVRTLFETASRVLEMDMAKLCFEGPAEALNSTENTQPALLLCSVAAYQVFRQQTGLSASVMAGHSLGELSALVCAGAISVEEGLKLARFRGLAMSRCAQPGETGMAAVTKLDRDQVETICAQVDGFGEQLVIANYNSAQQLVLSGEQAALQSAGDLLKAEGASFIPLRVSGAFHSPYMAAAADEFAEQVASLNWQTPEVPVLSNVTAAPYADTAAIVTQLTQQITGAVRWQDSLENLQATQPCDLFLEVGPGKVLRKLALTILPDARAYSLDDADDEGQWQQLLETDIRTLQERPSLLGKCMAVAVSTRNTNWNNDDYQQRVITPYQTLKQMHEQSLATGEQPARAQMQQALQLLQGIMAAKGASLQEQQERLQEVVQVTGADSELAEIVATLVAAN